MTKELDILAVNGIFDYLRSNIRDQMNELSDHLSDGGCKDYSDYRKCCGIIQGLGLAEREILDAKDKYEKL